MKPFLIGLCVLGRPKTTKLCLEALKRNSNPNLYDLIVTGQDENAEVSKVISSINMDFTYLHNPFNTGIVFGHNMMMSYRKPGQHYIKIDDDCIILTNDWLESFAKVLSDARIGSALGRRPTFWIDDPATRRYFHTTEKINGVWTEGSGEQGIVGAWWALKGEVLDKIGCFNEATAADDLDWNIRASVLGYKTVYVPDAVIRQPQDEPIVHPQSQANKLIVAINWKLQAEYQANFIRGVNPRLPSRFNWEEFNGCDYSYKTASDRNWELFKKFKDSDWEDTTNPLAEA